uniref:Uncharacterized protein n=1 Tax=Glossina pallidipes TaxID=7398 RepID=A0A1A9ZYX5_GLOPL
MRKSIINNTETEITHKGENFVQDFVINDVSPSAVIRRVRSNIRTTEYYKLRKFLSYPVTFGFQIRDKKKQKRGIERVRELEYARQQWRDLYVILIILTDMIFS